jgi:hypothetical protein
VTTIELAAEIGSLTRCVLKSVLIIITPETAR